VFRIDVLDGSHRRTVEVPADTAAIGRDIECALVLPGDATVSRRHAVIEMDVAGHCWVTDLGSRNGTRVNGRLISGRTSLHASDRVLIGEFVLVVAEGAVTETVGAEQSGVGRAQVETGLSTREVEVLRLVCAGYGDQQIADELVLSVKTVHSHLDRIRTKSGYRRRPELIRYAMDHGLA